MATPRNTLITTRSDRLRAVLAGVRLTTADAALLDTLASCDGLDIEQLADLLDRARSAGPAPRTTDHAADDGTSRPCATCPRVWSPLARRAHLWLVRRDGLGLMCPTCQNRQRRGVATEREAVAS